LYSSFSKLNDKIETDAHAQAPTNKTASKSMIAHLPLGSGRVMSSCNLDRLPGLELAKNEGLSIGTLGSLG
jgi:hypothetical protein